MRRLLVAAVALALLGAGPTLAAAPGSSSSADADSSLHERCKIFMGNRMDPRWVHDHGRDKTGAPTWPGGKPPTKAQMDAMHAQCLKIMAEQAPAASPN